MKKTRIISALITAAMLVSVTACGNGGGDSSSSSSGNDESGDSSSSSSETTELSLTEASTGAIDPGAPTGHIKWLGYYEIEKDQPDHVAMFEDLGGTVESEVCGSGGAYFERLGVLVVSDESPDLVRYEWASFPNGVSKNLYMPLDSYLNIDDPIWETCLEAIEKFGYNNKHYYFPQTINSNFALNYNKVAVAKEGFDDPMDLYEQGKWDWNSFKELLIKWCNLGEDYIGYNGVGGMSFVATTGKTLIEVTNTGEIINNTKDPDVQRCMEFLESLCKEKLTGEGYMSPQEAFLDGKLLFLGMGPTWTYQASQEALAGANVEYEMAVIPYPKDPQADEYYAAYDTYGYMIPSGAKNIKGAIDWIKVGREAAYDPDKAEEEKEKALSTDPVYYPKCASCKYSFIENKTDDLDTCPECDSPRKEKFMRSLWLYLQVIPARWPGSGCWR